MNVTGFIGNDFSKKGNVYSRKQSFMVTSILIYSHSDLHWGLRWNRIKGLKSQIRYRIHRHIHQTYHVIYSLTIYCFSNSFPQFINRTLNAQPYRFIVLLTKQRVLLLRVYILVDYFRNEQITATDNNDHIMANNTNNIPKQSQILLLNHILSLS